MGRFLRHVWLLFLLAPAGCSKEEDYMEVFREQQAAYRETADILATIKDEKTMADAKSALDERFKRFEAIAKRAKALPQPPPPSVVNRMKDEEFVMKRTMSHLQDQLKRVSELKGGKEFLRQFESGSPGVLPVVVK